MLIKGPPRKVPLSFADFAPFRRLDDRSLCEMFCFGQRGLLDLTFLTIGGSPVSIVGIVVVQRTVRIHVTDIVSIARVRRPKPRVTRLIATTLF